jgi:hypothetical protein
VPQLLSAAYVWERFALVTAAALAPIVFLSRRRVEWRWWELASIVLPFGLWCVLSLLVPRPKSMANIGEIGILMLGIVALAVLRVAVGRQPASLRLAWLGQIGLLLLVTIVYFTTPELPE